MLKELEKALKSRYNNGIGLPNIRYFDGTNMFSLADGQFESPTLEGSLELFLIQLNEFNKNEK